MKNENKHVTILGIDPGVTRIGFGLIKKERNRLTCLDYGVIENKGSKKSLAIKNTADHISKIIEKYKPDVAALEKIFFFKNQKTAINVSEMRGVILTILSLNTIMVHEFTPLQVKQAVSGYGRAEKDQVERMVRLILGLKEKIVSDDAADGLAVAICCAHTTVEQHRGG